MLLQEYAVFAQLKNIELLNHPQPFDRENLWNSFRKR
jgi:hypothetical protein